MRRQIFVCAVIAIFVFFANVFPVFSAETKPSEADGAVKELADARMALETYKNQIMKGPALAGLKKEVDDINLSFAKKNKDLSALIDSGINKNPAYNDLIKKNKDLDTINADLKKSRAAIEANPDIVRMKKEAADLRAKELSIEKEANSLAESKYNSDPHVKELLTKKEVLINVPKDIAKLKASVMNSPEVKSAQKEAADLNRVLAAKNNALAKATSETLKSDQHYTELEQKLKDAGNRLAELRKTRTMTPVKTLKK